MRMWCVVRALVPKMYPRGGQFLVTLLCAGAPKELSELLNLVYLYLIARHFSWTTHRTVPSLIYRLTTRLIGCFITERRLQIDSTNRYSTGLAGEFGTALTAGRIRHIGVCALRVSQPRTQPASQLRLRLWHGRVQGQLVKHEELGHGLAQLAPLLARHEVVG